MLPDIDKDVEESMRKQFLALFRFRVIARVVITNIHWIREENIFRGKSRKVRLSIVERFSRVLTRVEAPSLEDKFLLFRPIELRSKADKKYIYKSIGKLKFFRDFPLNTRRELSYIVKFISFGKNRYLVKKGHLPQAMYFIVEGKVLKKADDRINDAILITGNTIGTHELYYDEPHKFSYITMNPVQLLYIEKDAYCAVLSRTLQKHWNDISDAMSLFSYFTDYSEKTMREAFQNCTIKCYKPNDIIFGDGHGLEKSAYFIISGTCQFIDTLFVKCHTVGNNKSYSLYDSYIDWIEETNSQQSISPEFTFNSDFPYISNERFKFSKIRDPSGNISKYDGTSIGWSKTSRTTTINKIHKYWASNLPNNVEMVFMQSCLMLEGGCFNLGEPYNDRRVVSIDDVHCLIISRNWLFAQNATMFWDKKKRFIEKHIPTKHQLFQEYKSVQKNEKYKQQLVNDVLKRRPHYNTASVNDVPMTVRLFKK